LGQQHSTQKPLEQTNRIALCIWHFAQIEFHFAVALNSAIAAIILFTIYETIRVCKLCCLPRTPFPFRYDPMLMLYVMFPIISTSSFARFVVFFTASELRIYGDKVTDSQTILSSWQQSW